MCKKDYFISYNKSNKDWAKWVAGTLEENGFSVYLQAWDINPGDDFISKMNEFLNKSNNYIAIVSNDYRNSEYCKKEFFAAFNAHLKGSIDKFLPVRVEDCTVDSLFSTIVYIDIFDKAKEDAAKVLLNAVNNNKNPRKKGAFPGKTQLSSIAGALTDNTKPKNVTSLGCNIQNIDDLIIFETENNKKGDLFNKLVSDVFHSLGFGEAKYDVQRSGREIDIIIKHRTERKCAIVECKAHKSKTSGTDVNKFFGSYYNEKVLYELEGYNAVGYYVSASGFTEPAINQEKERSKSNKCDGIILLGPNELIRELVQGKVICSKEQAVDAMKSDIKNLHLCGKASLLACEYGWIWVLYYSEKPNQLATHFAFVHADGNQLVNSIADAILHDNSNSIFNCLKYIRNEEKDYNGDKKAAKEAYYKYLENELGEIQFEGMPADKEAGSVKVNLENVFVPLTFNYKAKDDKNNELVEKKCNISQLLSQNFKSAILAKPGGGKSTLVRRLALAYAYPERRGLVDDDLPNESWFPVYIRCRDLSNDANKSLFEIILSIVNRAEISQYETAFKSLVEDNLQDGKMLLLIDGLDEISNEKERICFVNQLRTFVATYPTVHLVVTSRETGFRAVAGTLSGYCTQYSIAALDGKQIRRLSLKWHNAILGDFVKAKEESSKVCETILNDSRIITLAENPLLLTTLLFVKRWLGYLPTKKCKLYEEMIKLLLVTWNSVAHDRLDMDETEPQLAFVAYYMTTKGQQKINRDELEKCIIASRKALPELLGYTKISASKFIDKVEERSSLLIQLGLEENENGKLVPSYEFSHLSFQEYLTAKAITEWWLPGDTTTDIVELIKPHIKEDQWKEVIPLIAVLSRQYAKPLIEHLIALSEQSEQKYKKSQQFGKFSMLDDVAALHLANCIASEVPLNQELLEKSVVQVIKRKKFIERSTFILSDQNFPASRITVFNTILESKYKNSFINIVEKNLFKNPDMEYLYQICEIWIEIRSIDNSKTKNLVYINNLLKSDIYADKISGALMFMTYSFDLNNKIRRKSNSGDISVNNEQINRIINNLIVLLQSNDDLSVFVAAWCVAWSGYNAANIISKKQSQIIQDILINIWSTKNYRYQIQRSISWAISSNFMKGQSININDCLAEKIDYYINKPRNEYDMMVSIGIALLTGYFDKNKANEILKANNDPHRVIPKYIEEQIK